MEANVAEVFKGTVKFYNAQKGYGFVIDQGTEKEYFFHVSDILDNNKVLLDDEGVTFSLVDGKRGIKATLVKRI